MDLDAKMAISVSVRETLRAQDALRDELVQAGASAQQLRMVDNAQQAIESLAYTIKAEPTIDTVVVIGTPPDED